MKIIRSPKKIQEEMEKLRRQGETIGFVPTMGALHEGHLSLVCRASKENDRVAVSIFVNPLQFGPREDYKKYPRVVTRDTAILKKEKVDYLFCPASIDLVGSRFSTRVKVSKLTEHLCGRYRPGHFEGVTTVVAKLFNLVKPHRVYFGAKDYQQAMVIRQMMEDLDFDSGFVLCPTVREKDGLAMSSRNRSLSPADRKRAAMISKILFQIRGELCKNKKLPGVLQKARKALAAYTDRLQYLEIVDPKTLAPLRKSQPRMVALAACFLGKTRLIDNVIIHL